MTLSGNIDYESEVLERYTAGEVAGMLELEYEQLVRVASCFTERDAQWRPAPGVLSALEIISYLALELLPHGPAPSLSDALHALDQLYAAWQAESTAFQRVQARYLAYHLGQLEMLRAILMSSK
ncbi:MAG: hypothetical protein M3220_11855 [Chloroflexota bacterium]|nr:hypothetical protein [Chloroflexota bacterium]